MLRILIGPMAVVTAHALFVAGIVAISGTPSE